MGFYENLVELCYRRKEPVTVAVSNAGVNRSATTRWKKGELPNDTSMLKLCNYLGVTKEELLGYQSAMNIKNATLVLSDTEAQLLTAWRNASIREKEDVAHALRDQGFKYASPKEKVV